MTRSEQREIERLIGEIAEEGTSAERISKLGAFLSDRPDLQGYYARVMAVHTLLAYELDLTLHQLTPLVEPESSICQAVECLDDDLTVGMATPWFSRWRASHVQRALMALAATVVVAALLWRPLTRFMPVANGRPKPSSAGFLTDGDRNLVVRDVHYLMHFSRATNSPLLSSILLPVANARQFPLVTFCSGSVWMEQVSGVRDRGHIIPVPPGSTIEVQVDADARCQNALAVVEIDMYGRINGSTVNFNNIGDEKESDASVAQIGSWSQQNNTTETKYFLFTGTHTLLERQSQTAAAPKNEVWRLSDYRVLLDMDHLVCIGWDDSGYTRTSSRARRRPASKADYDYDDISAFVRILPSEGRLQRSGKLRYVPRSDVGNLVVERDGREYEFGVLPGDSVIVRITTDAGFSNVVEVVEQETNQVVWRMQNEVAQKHESNFSKTMLYGIDNGTDQARRYYLRTLHLKGENTTGEVDPWRPTAYQVVEDETGILVGYEDRPEKTPLDWNDVLIQIRSVPKLP